MASICLYPGPIRLTWSFRDGVFFLQLNQIPKIPVKILEHRDHPIALFLGRPDERDASGDHAIVVPPEIVGIKEQEDSSARLIPDERQLPRLGCPGEQ